MATKPDGTAIHFVATCRIDTPVEFEYCRHGSILHKLQMDLSLESVFEIDATAPSFRGWMY